MTTDEKIAERYVNGIPIFAEEGEGYSRTQMQQAFLAGLKAGKGMNVPSKWHKVADGDLPKGENIHRDIYLKEMREEIKHELMLKLKDEGIVKPLKDSIISNKKLSSQEQQELCAWLECAMEFGEMLDECAKELEAGRPQWHNVADGDLPKEQKEYWCKVFYDESEETFNAFLWFDVKTKNFKFLEDIEDSFDVKFWCELPKYEEE